MNNDSRDDRFKEWRSILTLIVFFLANFCVAFPFHIRFHIPTRIFYFIRACVEILPSTSDPGGLGGHSTPKTTNGRKFSSGGFKIVIPINHTTGPLLAVAFLLVTTAITTGELRTGILGGNNLVPLDIIAFALTIGYISGSIDASGFLRHLTFRLVMSSRHAGHRLFFYLYCLFFFAGALFGNDPIIQMGMLIITYLFKGVSNIAHPRAWISMQYAIANIASAIFVSSGTTNVIIASAFRIGFAEYTINTVVPVIVTSFILFPFLLYVLFAHEVLVPFNIKLHDLTEEEQRRKPINPNLPYAGYKNATPAPENATASFELQNPFIDKLSASIGIILIIVSLVVLIALSAVSLDHDGNIPVFWVTLPAGFLMLVWDIICSWHHRVEIRSIIRSGRAQISRMDLEHIESAGRGVGLEAAQVAQQTIPPPSHRTMAALSDYRQTRSASGLQQTGFPGISVGWCQTCGIRASSSVGDKQDHAVKEGRERHAGERDSIDGAGVLIVSESDHYPTRPMSVEIKDSPKSPILTAKIWLGDTFSTSMAVLRRLPFLVVPFAIPMFVLVQALVDKGWVILLARGWSAWVEKTGTVGAVGGMGFLSIILSNFAGTNIGASVLLCRVLQIWREMHSASESAERSIDSNIPDRTWWGAVYALALGVNYGAFSLTFGASLAGLSWREDLADKHIYVRRLEFARVNFPIITMAMAVGCAVLLGQIYITR